MAHRVECVYHIGSVLNAATQVRILPLVLCCMFSTLSPIYIPLYLTPLQKRKKKEQSHH